MILVLLKMSIEPDRKAEFLRAVRSIREQSGAETGCLGSRLYQEVERGGVFALAEEWSTSTLFISLVVFEAIIAALAAMLFFAARRRAQKVGAAGG